MNGWVLESITDKDYIHYVRLILVRDGWVKLYAKDKRALQDHLDTGKISNLEYLEGLTLCHKILR